MVKLDGTSNKHVKDGESNFNVWRIIGSDGSLICAFYGPNSLGCAQYVEDGLNKTGGLLQPDFSRVFEAE